MLNDLRYRLRALFKRDAMDRELDDELRFHLEKETAKLVSAGMSPDEARRQARRVVRRRRAHQGRYARRARARGPRDLRRRTCVTQPAGSRRARSSPAASSSR